MQNPTDIIPIRVGAALSLIFKTRRLMPFASEDMKARRIKPLMYFFWIFFCCDFASACDSFWEEETQQTKKKEEKKKLIEIFSLWQACNIFF